MADSDNSRTLSSVTRRELLSASAVWLGARSDCQRQNVVEIGEATGEDEDAVRLWREWMTAQQEFERLCEFQQRLESQMIAEVGFPHIEISLAGQQLPTRMYSIEDIDSVLGGEPYNEEERVRLKAEFVECQRPWDELDEKLGYSRATKAEERASVIRDTRARALWAEPVRSRTGIAAKLHAILYIGREECADDGFPWSQIAALLRDVIASGTGG